MLLFATTSFLQLSQVGRKQHFFSFQFDNITWKFIATTNTIQFCMQGIYIGIYSTLPLSSVYYLPFIHDLQSTQDL
jgi:hypothetical protein